MFHKYSIFFHCERLLANLGKVEISRLQRYVEADVETNHLFGSMEVKFCTRSCASLETQGIHAREWISTATALWTLHTVLQDEQMVDNLDWFFHIVVNPDGFTFTHEHVS